jgi:hypothetical protein
LRITILKERADDHVYGFAWAIPDTKYCIKSITVLREIKSVMFFYLECVSVI